MHRLIPFLLILLFSCTLPAEKKAREEAAKNSDSTISMQTSDVNAAEQTSLPTETLPPVQKIKRPDGIYQAVLNVDEKVEQTIAFNSNLTYHLQEKYLDRKDSIVITEGNWTPSDGYIWLYKEQVARGRYKWNGNTLQYYSPVSKKSFDMRHLLDAFENVAWKNKGKQGLLMFGIGTEPFWRVEFTKKDTLSFLLSEWDAPIKLRVNSSFYTKDSIGYAAQNDSVQLRVTIFPLFCSDGMSDFTYRNKIIIHYDQQVYNGCGMLYK